MNAISIIKLFTDSIGIQSCSPSGWTDSASVCAITVDCNVGLELSSMGRQSQASLVA